MNLGPCLPLATQVTVGVGKKKIVKVGEKVVGGEEEGKGVGTGDGRWREGS